jgi:hypothetical protein
LIELAQTECGECSGNETEGLDELEEPEDNPLPMDGVEVHA